MYVCMYVHVAASEKICDQNWLKLLNLKPLLLNDTYMYINELQLKLDMIF